MRPSKQLTYRAYRDEADYWRIREFLREVFRINDRRELSWPPYRFDYWRWHGLENIEQLPPAEAMFLWETADGRIAAALTMEGRGEAFFQMHPALRSAALETELLHLAEEKFAVQSAAGKRLCVWANEHDSLRQTLLRTHGYRQEGGAEYQRQRLLSQPIPDLPAPEGYRVRSLGDVAELPARSWASWRAFHPDAPDAEYSGWEWYRNVQRTPLYRRDFDLVAVAPGDGIAAFCTVWFDDVTRTGAFEPVGCMPEHQRRGLGKALMYEGLRRLRYIGATLATVGSYSPEAHALYAAAGFTKYELSEPWLKEW